MALEVLENIISFRQIDCICSGSLRGSIDPDRLLLRVVIFFEQEGLLLLKDPIWIDIFPVCIAVDFISDIHLRIVTEWLKTVSGYDVIGSCIRSALPTFVREFST